MHEISEAGQLQFLSTVCKIICLKRYKSQPDRRALFKVLFKITSEPPLDPFCDRNGLMVGQQPFDLGTHL